MVTVSNAFDDVCEIFGRFLDEVVEKEKLNKDDIVAKMQKKAAEKEKLSLVAHDGAENFEQWLDLMGFHHEEWKTEYIQALKDLFYSN